ncbi:MAG: guanylate kinase [Lachnospiraceae bacterium]
MGKIFYIMGKSATGKDKIFSLLQEAEGLNLQKLILYTTRPIRKNEQNGKQYYFVSETDLEQMTEAGKVIEVRSYHTVHGVWSYFTAYDEQMNLEKFDYIGIGTIESYEKLVEYFGTDVLYPIYVEVEDGERLTRALKREKKQKEPKYEELCRRFLADGIDFSEENIVKAGIKVRFNNVDLENCVQEIKAYISKNIAPMNGYMI